MRAYSRGDLVLANGGAHGWLLDDRIERGLIIIGFVLVAVIILMLLRRIKYHRCLIRDAEHHVLFTAADGSGGLKVCA